MEHYPVYIVDDDDAVRDAWALLLKTIGIDSQGFGDPLAFLDRVPSLEPGCVLMDIRMPMISGLKVQERLVEAGCDWPLIVISGHGDINACRQAFKNGAVDFLCKPADEQELIDAIQKAQFILTNRSDKSARVYESKGLIATLSEREKEVVDMIARGWSTKEIARAFDLSPRTVESHRANITEKLQTTSVAEITRIVLEAKEA